MSVDKDAGEIIKGAEQCIRTKNKEEKFALIDDMEKANERIHATLREALDPSFYKEVISDAPPIRKKTPKKKAPPAPRRVQQMPRLPPKPIKGGMSISTMEKRRLMRELKIDKDTLKKIYKGKKQKALAPDFTVYAPSPLGSLANSMFKHNVENLTKNHPVFFNNLFHTIHASGMSMLSKTYASIMLLMTATATVFSLFLALMILFFLEINIIITFVSAVLIAAFTGALTFILMYVYPSSQAATKARAIENDLPFAIIHMAAVAGSGAQPIAIFKLLLSAGEYKGLESEIKKVVNYVNLFGYDLSTALKNVSLTTPSKRFRDVLNGIAATIESGGSLKSYLRSMADDTMTTYKLERKKYVASLSTYYDIYTGILIAAPLLFMVTLAIINLLGGTIGGIPLATIALVGTYGAIPFMNIGFFLFLNIMQPGT